VVQLAIFIGWLMTGGTARTAAIRRAALRLATRIPGSATRTVHTMWPAFRRVHSCTPQAGSASSAACARSHGSAGALLDDLLGTGFAIVYRGPDRIATYDPPDPGVLRPARHTVVRVDDLPDGCRARPPARQRPGRRPAAAAGPHRRGRRRHPDLRAWLRTSAPPASPGREPRKKVRHAR
jgi:3-(3-hydroxy-phenyl)propionate hydroxylase